MMIPLVSFESLHEILRKLFDSMLPLCERMTVMASAIACIGALLYISYRVLAVYCCVLSPLMFFRCYDLLPCAFASSFSIHWLSAVSTEYYPRLLKPRTLFFKARLSV